VGQDAQVSSAHDDLATRLADWLGAPGHPGAFSPPVTVTALSRLSGGASRQSFRVDLATGDGPRQVVLQRVRPQGISSGIGREVALLELAAAAGVSVPRVLASTEDPDVVGGPAMVVEFLAGEALARAVLRDERYATARDRLPAHAASALAAIHRMADPGLHPEDPVHTMAALHRGTGRAQPVFDLALRWLADNQPPAPTQPVVVHGDFRLGNLLTDDDGLVAVLDWELAHLGDPTEDLTWACVKAWRFGSPQPALGLCGIDAWIDAYVAAGGERPSEDRLRWWLVYGTLRWGVICELQAAAHLSGAVDSVELAILGRRVAETEHDLLGLLGHLDRRPAAPVAIDPADADRHTDQAPHDAPTVEVLLSAVERYLRASEGDSSSRYHDRVAANALGIVRRQLVVGPAHAAAHAHRLASLGVADDAALGHAIATGAFDDRFVELGQVLAEAVADKLVVANPTYLVGPPADPWAH
jgi:aminoglycoside phosphotransferase (APT) family kinase protein